MNDTCEECGLPRESAVARFCDRCLELLASRDEREHRKMLMHGGAPHLYYKAVRGELRWDAKKRKWR